MILLPIILCLTANENDDDSNNPVDSFLFALFHILRWRSTSANKLSKWLFLGRFDLKLEKWNYIKKVNFELNQVMYQSNENLKCFMLTIVLNIVKNT